jgi:hypothetical protein
MMIRSSSDTGRLTGAKPPPGSIAIPNSVPARSRRRSLRCMARQTCLTIKAFAVEYLMVPQIPHRPFLKGRVEPGEYEETERQQGSRDEDVPYKRVTGEQCAGFGHEHGVHRIPDLAVLPLALTRPRGVPRDIEAVGELASRRLEH